MYGSISPSYDLNAMNSVTMTTNMHTFHINGICPLSKYAWHNAHVPLHSILHIDPAFLHTPIKNQYTATNMNQTIAKYLSGTNIPFKCQICASCPNYLMCMYRGMMPICMPCKKSLCSKLWSIGRATGRQMYGL